MNTAEQLILYTERQYGSIYQYISQKICIILRLDILIYRHFSVKVGSEISSSSFLFFSNVVVAKGQRI